jgi:hypothetical protein
MNDVKYTRLFMGIYSNIVENKYKTFILYLSLSSKMWSIGLRPKVLLQGMS